jgi:hypothetical protein
VRQKLTPKTIFQQLQLLASSDVQRRRFHLLDHHLPDHEIHIEAAAHVQGVDV